MDAWKSVGDKFLFGIAKHNFYQDECVKLHRLSLDVGDAVIIIREEKNWYYGYAKKNKKVFGIFPKSYVQLVECEVVKNEYVIKRSEIVKEITTVLIEWATLFKRYYLTQHTILKTISQKIWELIRLRSQILSGNLPLDEMREIKLKATAEIDTGNKILGLDMVVRDECGNILDINATSTTQLYGHHINATERIRSANTSQNKNRSSKTLNRHSHNLLVSFYAFVCKYQEDCDLLITLYDAEEMKAITENYVVRWGRHGFSKDIDRFDNHRVLFTDLSTQDMNRNKVYLICYAIRIGGMESKEIDIKRASALSNLSLKKQQNQSLNGSISSNCEEEMQMRRPFGVAAIDLTPILKRPEDFKNNLDLPFILCEKDTLQNTLKKLIMNKDIGKMDSKLAVSVEILHGDTKQIKDEYPHLLSRNVVFARKMGFPEVIYPGDVRNDLYLTMVCGEFTKGTKTSDKNIEVTATVYTENGTEVPNVILLGAAFPLCKYKSVIYYHEDKPKWNETFKIQVPIEDFKTCHLKFTFKHRSSNDSKDRMEKPFALSYVRLMQENGTTLQDKSHQLIVYKIDHKKYDDENQFCYLKLPSLIKELEKDTKPSGTGLTIANKDVFTIATNLCSTKLTQDLSLLGFLNWSSQRDNLEESLQALMSVGAEEVVKFLQDILDALFNILAEVNKPEIDDLVFTCLLRLIEIVSDLKYQHFQSVLDLYINESFSATLAYEKLINILQTYIINAINNKMPAMELEGWNDEKPSERKLFKTTKNLQYIIKLIIRSRILYASMFGDKENQSFESSMEELIGSIKNLLKCPKDLLRSQGAVLKYLHVIGSDLMQVYDPIKLSKHISDIIENIPSGRLTQSKMNCIKELVDSKLFIKPECRSILLPVICKQIRDRLENKEEGDAFSEIWQHEKNLEKAAKILGEKKSHLHRRETTVQTQITDCVNIMNNLLELLFRQEYQMIRGDIHEIVKILLRTVIQTSITIDRDNPLCGNIVAIMLGIFRSMHDEHYKAYVRDFRTKFDLQDFLTEILLLYKALVETPVFPSDWMDMIMHQNTVILGSLQYFTEIIMNHFFDPFEKQVWSNFFHCTIAFIIQQPLQLDQFSDNKQDAILSRYKDIRQNIVAHIVSMWYNLGEKKTRFVPELVGPILEMSLIPDKEIREATIPLFFDMMQCEFYSSRYVNESYGDTKRNNSHYKGNFSDFEQEMIEKLDVLVESGRGDNEYKEIFYDRMMELCTAHSMLQYDGVTFVETVTNLLEHLLEYRCIKNDDSKENRMSCTVSLLEFYSDVKRKEMYIRYVNKLCDLHMEFENYTEAAFTLKLHSTQLQWDDTPLSPLLRSSRHNNRQTHRQLKEALYYEIIDFFDKGKMWECAIQMCEELAELYREVTYDYINLSCILGKCAIFYRNIMKELRHKFEYFRVSFYGLGFSKFLRNRTFIYRGKEYEKLSDFSSRILTQHPGAELMQTLTSPGDEITQSEGQYIQINSVQAMTDDYSEKFCDKNVAQEISSYYKNNNVSTFMFSRPFRVIKEGQEHNDAACIWLERTIMKTTHQFPGILRWFPIEIPPHTIKVSPLEHAVETMDKTNNALHEIVVAHVNDDNLAINPLSMKISGIVDPAVMGGFSKYEEAFLTENYLEENPDDESLVKRLKELISQQIPILDAAITVHKMKAPASLLPFHERLESCFIEMKSNIEQKYGKSVCDIKLNRDSLVKLRRQNPSQQLSVDSNRLSEASMGSTDSGLSKSTQSNRLQASSIKSTFASFNFNTSNLTRNSLSTNTLSKKAKDKTPNKRRSSKKLERETIIPASPSSQWYTPSVSSLQVNTSLESDVVSISSVSAISATPVNTPVVELTEELTPKRPLRSSVEKDRRISRTTSFMSTNSASRNHTASTHSLSEGESNRNSIITTESTSSTEDDLVPPPLPAKTRDSNDYSNLLNQIDAVNTVTLRNQVALFSKPLPNIPYTQIANSSYDTVDINRLISLDERKRPPTPPPKPARNPKSPTPL